MKKNYLFWIWLLAIAASWSNVKATPVDPVGTHTLLGGSANWTTVANQNEQSTLWNLIEFTTPLSTSDIWTITAVTVQPAAFYGYNDWGSHVFRAQVTADATTGYSGAGEGKGGALEFYIGGTSQGGVKINAIGRANWTGKTDPLTLPDTITITIVSDGSGTVKTRITTQSGGDYDLGKTNPSQVIGIASRQDEDVTVTITQPIVVSPDLDISEKDTWYYINFKGETKVWDATGANVTNVYMAEKTKSENSPVQLWKFVVADASTDTTYYYLMNLNAAFMTATSTSMITAYTSSSQFYVVADSVNYKLYQKGKAKAIGKYSSFITNSSSAPTTNSTIQFEQSSYKVPVEPITVTFSNTVTPSASDTYYYVQFAYDAANTLDYVGIAATDSVPVTAIPKKGEEAQLWKFVLAAADTSAVYVVNKNGKVLTAGSSNYELADAVSDSAKFVLKSKDGNYRLHSAVQTNSLKHLARYKSNASSAGMFGEKIVDSDSRYYLRFIAKADEADHLFPASILSTNETPVWYYIQFAQSGNVIKDNGNKLEAGVAPLEEGNDSLLWRVIYAQDYSSSVTGYGGSECASYYIINKASGNRLAYISSGPDSTYNNAPMSGFYVQEITATQSINGKNISGTTLSGTTLHDGTFTQTGYLLHGNYNATATYYAVEGLLASYPEKLHNHAAATDAAVINFIREIPLRTVYFDSNRGSAIDSIEVDHGAKATAPATPVREGYTFAGWFTSTSWSVEWDFDLDVITSDTVLYAKWTHDPVEPFGVHTLYGGQGDWTTVTNPNETGTLWNRLNFTTPLLTSDTWVLKATMTETADYAIDGWGTHLFRAQVSTDATTGFSGNGEGRGAALEFYMGGEWQPADWAGAIGRANWTGASGKMTTFPVTVTITITSDGSGSLKSVITTDQGDSWDLGTTNPSQVTGIAARQNSDVSVLIKKPLIISPDLDISEKDTWYYINFKGETKVWDATGANLTNKYLTEQTKSENSPVQLWKFVLAEPATTTTPAYYYLINLNAAFMTANASGMITAYTTSSLFYFEDDGVDFKLYQKDKAKAIGKYASFITNNSGAPTTNSTIQFEQSSYKVPVEPITVTFSNTVTPSASDTYYYVQFAYDAATTLDYVGIAATDSVPVTVIPKQGDADQLWKFVLAAADTSAIYVVNKNGKVLKAGSSNYELASAVSDSAKFVLKSKDGNYRLHSAVQTNSLKHLARYKSSASSAGMFGEKIVDSDSRYYLRFIAEADEADHLFPASILSTNETPVWYYIQFAQSGNVIKDNGNKLQAGVAPLEEGNDSLLWRVIYAQDYSSSVTGYGGSECASYYIINKASGNRLAYISGGPDSTYNNAPMSGFYVQSLTETQSINGKTIYSTTLSGTTLHDGTFTQTGYLLHGNYNATATYYAVEGLSASYPEKLYDHGAATDASVINFVRAIPVRTVTFDTQGGSAVASVTVDNGQKITKPADPTRANYAFLGWFTDVNYTVEWDFDLDVVVSDTTLYAKWKDVSGIPTTAVRSLKTAVTDGVLTIDGLLTGETFRLYNTQGILIRAQQAIAPKHEVALPAHGVYVVAVDGKKVKIVY